MWPLRLTDLFSPGLYSFTRVEARRRMPGALYWLNLPYSKGETAFIENLVFHEDGTGTCTRLTPPPSGFPPIPPLVTTLFLDAQGVWLFPHISQEEQAEYARLNGLDTAPEPQAQLWLPFSDTHHSQWGTFQVWQEGEIVRFIQMYPGKADRATETLCRPGEWVTEYVWLSGQMQTRQVRRERENRPL